jgi:hypothetical protein
VIPVEVASSVAGTRTEALLAPAVLAAVAVRAAAAVPGVRRVQPGMAGLIGSVVRSARQRVKGLNPAATEGARVTVGPGTDGKPLAHVEIGIAVAGQAMAVGDAVRVAVAAELAAVGAVRAVVTVLVLDIELPR